MTMSFEEKMQSRLSFPDPDDFLKNKGGVPGVGRNRLEKAISFQYGVVETVPTNSWICFEMCSGRMDIFRS